MFRVETLIQTAASFFDDLRSGSAACWQIESLSESGLNPPGSFEDPLPVLFPALTDPGNQFPHANTVEPGALRDVGGGVEGELVRRRDDGQLPPSLAGHHLADRPIGVVD